MMVFSYKETFSYEIQVKTAPLGGKFTENGQILSILLDNGTRLSEVRIWRFDIQSKPVFLTISSG